MVPETKGEFYITIYEQIRKRIALSRFTIPSERVQDTKKYWNLVLWKFCTTYSVGEVVQESFNANKIY
jgi:hypothetical protein